MELCFLVLDSQELRQPGRMYHKEKLNIGATLVTQLGCHGNDEIASVRRVRCRVLNEASLKQKGGLDRDRASRHDAEAMAGTSACVHC